MKKELDDALCRDFPLLYADRHASMQETCMCWGFDCDDGWHDIIREASAKLEALIVAMPEDQRQHYRAAQVKEKFGGLRLYMTASTPEMDAIISAAEDRSFVTCEACGAVGKRRGGGWILTLCDDCNSKRGRTNDDV